ncbi:Flp pilus assembly complex ATPase component TadA, partial [Candidatus Micrarchaeota archaeon]|nr:Flp pilus assembly complex ATPase component TadA [Candidatus Micrarchaeota archaeon]
MANYLKDLVKKAKRIKTEKEQIKPEPEKKEVKEEEVRKTLILDKRKKEKERRAMLEKELAEKIPQEKGSEKNKEEAKEEPVASSVELELDAMDKKEIDSYGEVKVYRVPEKVLLYYVVPVSKPTLGERTVINTIKEAATRLISIAPYKIRDPEQRRTVYKQRIKEILQASNELNIPERRFDFYAESVVREMVGYGLIDPLIRDDQLEEIMVIGPRKPVYVFHRRHEMMVTNIEFFSDSEIIDLINRIAREVGRRVDISSPLLDARLADGSRVNATIPPASPSGASLTIRKFRADPYSIIDLIQYGTFDVKSAAFAWLCVDGLGVKPANILITGGTGSGKTTTLNVLASFIPERERIVTIEDTAELSLPLKHIIRMEARPPGLEGTGEITLDVLTKNSLRMRPDRVIVGEVRHDEAFTLFTAMNTGHDGMACPDSLIQLADGSIKEIGVFCEDYFKKNEVKRFNGIAMTEIKQQKPEIISINKENLSQQTAKVNAIWKRECKESFILKMSSGREIKLSYDHPVFRLKNGFLGQVQSHECETGDYLCVSNEIKIEGKKFSEDYAYFLGLLLGDGHLRKGRV